MQNRQNLNEAPQKVRAKVLPSSNQVANQSVSGFSYSSSAKLLKLVGVSKKE